MGKWSTKEYKETRGYKVLGVSMYNADIDGLKDRVRRLRELGWSGASQSALIRVALSKLDDDKLAEIAAEMTTGGRR